MPPHQDRRRFVYFLGQWAHQCWDHLGYLFLLGGLFFLTVSSAFGLFGCVSTYYSEGSLPFWPGGCLLLAGLVIGFWGCCLGWLAFHKSIDQILRFEDFEWLDYLRHLKTYLKESVLLAICLGGSVTILVFNLFAYRQMLRNDPILRGIALAGTLWMLLFVGMIQVHLVPFLTHQECPFRTALGRAIKVTLWKPFRTLFLLFLEMPAVLFIPPFCFILPSIAVVANQLSLMILLDDWEDPYEKTSEALRAGV